VTDVQQSSPSGLRRGAQLTAQVGQGLPKSARLTLYALGGFALFSLVRVVAGAPSLTSGSTFIATVAAASPILLAGLGGLFAERSGIVNIGLDGMMVLGTWFGGWAGWHYGPWAALAFGAFGGALGGLVHGIATVTFGVNQIVSGIAINLIAPGITRFMSSQIFINHADGSITQSPSMSSAIGHFTVPGVSTFLDWLNRREWFLISDLAGAILGFTKNMAWSTLLAWALIPISFYVLWRTAFGLRLRSAGEKPSATDSLGVSVYKMRYLGVLISGALAGLGGAWLAVDIRAYNQDQVAGRGFQGLAAMIFGNWRPAGIGAGAGLFAFGQSLTFSNNQAVLALFLLAALAFTGVAVVLTVRRKMPQAVGMLVIGVLAFVYYQLTSTVDSRIVYITPYVVTLLVLAFASQRLRPPAAEGVPWFKGQSE
jgi:simple sugar transport system permease protein